jgi:hypothetical protein
MLILPTFLGKKVTVFVEHLGPVSQCYYSYKFRSIIKVLWNKQMLRLDLHQSGDETSGEKMILNNEFRYLQGSEMCK